MVGGIIYVEGGEMKGTVDGTPQYIVTRVNDCFSTFDIDDPPTIFVILPL
jgi:hypothetical protein